MQKEKKPAQTQIHGNTLADENEDEQTLMNT